MPGEATETVPVAEHELHQPQAETGKLLSVRQVFWNFPVLILQGSTPKARLQC